MPTRLPPQQPPDRFDQQHAQVLVTVPALVTVSVDRAEALDGAGAVFAGTTTGVMPTALRWAKRSHWPPRPRSRRQSTHLGPLGFVPSSLRTRSAHSSDPVAPWPSGSAPPPV